MPRPSTTGGRLAATTALAVVAGSCFIGSAGRTDDKLPPRLDLQIPGGPAPVGLAGRKADLADVDPVRRTSPRVPAVRVSQLVPVLGAELRLFTATTEPTPEQRRAVALAGGKAIRTFATSQAGRPVRLGINRRQPTVAPDPRRAIRGALDAAAVDLMGTDRAALYLREWDRRDMARHEAATLCLVARLDETLFINPDQREQILAALRDHWAEDAFPTLEGLQTLDRHVPSFLLPLIGPILTQDQRRILAIQPTVNFAAAWGQPTAMGTDAGRFANDELDDDPDLQAAEAEARLP